MPLPALPEGVRSIVDAALAQLDNAIHIAGEDAIIAYLAAKYDQHLAPLNIPYVPDALEPVLIDSPIKAGIAHLVRTGHAAIHKDPAPIIPPPAGSAPAEGE